MPILTEIKNWRIPLVLVFLALMIWGGSKGRRVGLLAVLTLALTDNLNSQFIKEVFARERPCMALDNVRLLIGMKRSFSFPSSHAVNVFGVATLVSYYYPVKRVMIPLMLLAAAIGYSRIYVGVHYPLDVVSGAVLGGCLALLMIFIEKNVSNLYIYHTGEKK